MCIFSWLMHTGRGQLLYINHLKCTLYFHFCTLQCYSEALQAHYILPRLLNLLNVYFLSPDWQPVSCWYCVARLSALRRTEMFRKTFRNMQKKKRQKALTSQWKGKKKRANPFLITQTSTHRGRAIGDYIYVTSGKRGRAAGFVKSREKLCCRRCHPR